MRKLVPKAENKHELFSLQLFAQILEELLFDHSDDSYKAPALNTHSRVRELAVVVADIYISNVPYQSATPFFEELEFSIKHDHVLDADEVELMLQVLGEIQRSISDQEKTKTLISVLEGYVKTYYKKLVPALRAILHGDLKDKARLLQLTADFIVELELRGYSRRYVYAETKRRIKHPLYQRETINPQIVLDDFFSCFTRGVNKYEVYFAGSSALHYSPDIHKKFGVTYREDFDDVTLPSVPSRYVAVKLGEGCRFYGIALDAHDGMRAREKAEKLMDLFASALVFCNHGDGFKYYPDAIVLNKTSGDIYVLSAPPNPMQVRTSDEVGANERFELIDKVIQQNKDHLRSIFKLFNVFRLHRLGIRSANSVNQLLDLWAGLEGFISRPGKDVVRISHFSNQLSAVLTLTYAEKLFQIVTEEIQHSSKRAAELVDLIDGATRLEKVVKLVVARELEGKRKELGEIIGASNPLLCFRIWQLKKRFGTRKAVGETLRLHQRKITWQVCRIYHARNTLMHTAETPDYLPTLVEHLHGYTDSLFWAITKLSVRSKHSAHIDGVMALLATQEKILLAEYERSKEEECTLENAMDIVFGRTNPLKPELAGFN